MFELRADVRDRVVEPGGHFAGLGDDGATDVGGRDLDDLLVGQTEASGARMVAWKRGKRVFKMYFEVGMGIGDTVSYLEMFFPFFLSLPYLSSLSLFHPRQPFFSISFTTLS